MNEPQHTPGAPPSTTTAKIIYLLYLAGILVGITGLIGVIMAYINRGAAPSWLQSHYHFQIRTFWIGLLYLFLGGLLTQLVVGWMVLLFWLVWLIVRCAIGIKYLDQTQPHPNPTTWLFN